MFGGGYRQIQLPGGGGLTEAEVNTLIAAYAQSLDADLTAIAGLSAAGIIARTGSGTAAARTLTGTSNRITITNGDGVSGAPTFDIGSDVVTLTGSQSLSNKTLTTPTIASFTNAPHSHANAAGGGTLNQSATHGSPDTDAATSSLHHTIGSSATQAAAGNHTHTAKQLLVAAPAAGVPAGATRYLAVGGGVFGASEANQQVTQPFACTLKNLYVHTNGTQPGGGSLVAVLMVNGSPSTLTITFAAGATSGWQSDITHTVAVSAGDLLDIRFVNNDGGTASATVGIVNLEMDTTL